MNDTAWAGSIPELSCQSRLDEISWYLWCPVAPRGRIFTPNGSDYFGCIILLEATHLFLFHYPPPRTGDPHQLHPLPLYSLHPLQSSFQFYCLIQTVPLSKVTNDRLMAFFPISIPSDISTAFGITLPSWGKKYSILDLVSIVLSEITSFIQTSISGALTMC